MNLAHIKIIIIRQPTSQYFVESIVLFLVRCKKNDLLFA